MRRPGETGNIDEVPGFVDGDGADDVKGTADDDVRLLEDSPCINVGDPGRNYSGQTDLEGQERVVYGAVDMGADEFVWHGDLDLDGDVDAHDFMTFMLCYNRSMQPVRPECE